MQKNYLQYKANLNVFGIDDTKIEALKKQNQIPYICLNPLDYKKYIDVAEPKENAPLIGFLCCREKDMYSADFNYVKSLTKSGARLRFLTYDNVAAQMYDIDALMLPGGRFPSPKQFYIDELSAPEQSAGVRSDAYLTCIDEAEKREMPIFGVCAGAQMLACVHGFKLYKNVKQAVKSDLEHKTIELEAHKIRINENTILHKLLGTTEAVVNSRHIEALVNNNPDSDIQIYAVASDNVPEAWGNEAKNILCIQWHPEDFAAVGSKSMQNLYNWLAQKAAERKAKK